MPLPSSPKLVRDLLLAVAVAAAALMLQWTLALSGGRQLPFMLIAPAIIFTAATLGRLPATLLLLAGVANVTVALAPPGHWFVDTVADWLTVIASLLVGSLLIVYGARLKLRSSRAEQAERRLTLAQDETGIGLFELDYRAGTAYASPALCQMLGQPVMDGSMPLAEWLNALNAGHVEDSRRTLQQKVAAGELRYERELRVALPDGQTRWLLSRIRLDVDARGELLASRGATLDITARKQLVTELEGAQFQLKQQLDDLSRLNALGNQLLAMPFLDAALQAMLEAVCAFHDTPFGLLQLFDAAGGTRVVAQCGFTAQALAQWVDAADRSGAAAGQRVLASDIQQDERFVALRPLAHALGTRALHSTPLRASGGGRVLGAFTVLRAVPGEPGERLLGLTDLCASQAAALIERDQALSLARESQQRFEVALQSSPVAFTILAPVRDAAGPITDFTWTYANPAAAALIGRPVQDLAGRRIRDVLPHAWDEPGFLAHYQQVSENGRTFQSETFTNNPTRGRWLQVIASPLNGLVVVWFTDITQRREERQALQEASRRKDEFLATLAHELRNPLAPIRHAATIVRDPAASPAQRQWSLAVIERQLQHMALLLDDLLDVSRITRDTLQLRRRRVALHDIVDAAVEVSGPLFSERQHALRLDLPHSPVWLDVDPLRIAQVLGNLLVNAAKYTEPGGEVALRARLDGGDLVIDVTDNGIGLQPEDCDRVFEIFTQVAAGAGDLQRGLGIGLALARKLMQLHGGQLEAHSPGPGAGSTFTARLPVALLPEAAAATPDVTSAVVHAEQPAEQPATAAGSKRRILIADDNRDAADSLALLLGMHGHEVQVAYDGREALARFHSFHPEVALLDMGMPEHTGTEVATLIRSQQRAPITLVALTGFGQPSDRQRALDAGFDHHLIKPIQLEQLQSMIDALTTTPASGA
jgi:PAS domain S-box-containing protein